MFFSPKRLCFSKVQRNIYSFRRGGHGAGVWGKHRKHAKRIIAQLRAPQRPALDVSSAKKEEQFAPRCIWPLHSICRRAVGVTNGHQLLAAQLHPLPGDKDTQHRGLATGRDRSRLAVPGKKRGAS